MAAFQFKLLSAVEIVDFERVLNTAGAEGFDVVQVIPGNGCWYAMMKRSIGGNHSSLPASNLGKYTPVKPVTADATKTTAFPQSPGTFG